MHCILQRHVPAVYSQHQAYESPAKIVLLYALLCAIYPRFNFRNYMLVEIVGSSTKISLKDIC
jgi:hypothetical protein